MDRISNRLARFIKAKRTERGLTQERLAVLAAIEYKHIQNLESFKRINDPKLSTLIKLANAFEISISEIVDYIVN
jgi:transcriptional regulator with XRE-family HTH domain